LIFVLVRTIFTKLDMKKSYTYLRNLLVILMTMSSYSAYSAACATPWDVGTTYSVNGTAVSYDGNNYTSQWWTNGDTPNPAAGGPWGTGVACGAAPTLTTTGPDAEGCTTMDMVGNISDVGDPATTEKGFFWGTDAAAVDAATDLSFTCSQATIASGGLGDFTTSLTLLTGSTTYYFKAYALNTFGTAYGVRTDGTTTAPCTAPTVTTTGSSDVECVAATMEGNVTVHGNSAVTKGFIYNTSSAVVTAATIGSLGGATQVDHATVATATGAFTYTENGFANSTTYYFKSHATNTTGSGYGTVLNFTTGAGCGTPTVSATTAATQVVCTTANPGGNVTADGGAEIRERGLCYKTSTGPTTGDTKSIQAGTTGSWTGSLTGLTASTTYYVRTYAINSEGTSYGTETSFTTLSCPAVTYYTLNDGDYATAANWNCTCVPDFTMDSHNSFRMYHDMTYTGTLSDWTSPGASYIMPGGSLETTAGLSMNLTGGGGDITIYSGASLTVGTALTIAGFAGLDLLSAGNISVTNALTINGASDLQTTGGDHDFGSVDLTSEGQLNLVNSTLQIDNDLGIGSAAGLTATGTPVNIDGNYTNSGDVDATYDGLFRVDGNILNTGNSTITIEGAGSVGGNVTGTGNGDYTVNGTLSITGALTLNTDADLDGTGTVGWGSADVDGIGGSYIKCVGAVVSPANLVRDTKVANDTYDPPVPAPANPIDLSTCGAGTLPVELILFSASKYEGDINVSWVTGSEINNDYFEVLGSSDGVTWEVLGLVQGAGNSFNVTEYEFVHQETEEQSIKYVRLKQVDFEGHLVLYKIVALERSDDLPTLLIYPNPVSDVLSMGVNSLESGKYKILIVNAQGQTVENMNVFIKDGANSINLLIAGLNNGLYTVVFVNSNEKRFSKRFIKN
jgi:hypothetical protein